MKQLTVPEQHQLKVARHTLELSEVGAFILGSPSHEEARAIIKRLTQTRKEKGTAK